MDTEPPRLALAMSALGGALVYGTFQLVTALWSGQPVERADVVRALVNVAATILVGVLSAYFLGPALMACCVPVASLREPHVVGFCIGATAWLVAPIVFGVVRDRAKQKAKELR